MIIIIRYSEEDDKDNIHRLGDKITKRTEKHKIDVFLSTSLWSIQNNLKKIILYASILLLDNTVCNLNNFRCY